MKHTTKATRRSISCFAQIVQRLPGYKIEQLAADKKIKARELSYSSQLYLLMLGQFLHAFSLNEIADIAKVHKHELSRIRGITAPLVNTFSNANRTRDPAVAESFYWLLRDMFSRETPGFRNVRNRGPLAKFKTRRIFAIDASVIPLTVSSIDWAKYIHRKSAAKMHARTNVANMLPDFVVIDSAHHHEAKKAPEMCADLHAGDVVIGDRGYYSFDFFNDLDERGITFVSREKSFMQYGVTEDLLKPGSEGNIISDEKVVLTGWSTSKKYQKPFRRIKAVVEVNGQPREMVFVTNNFNWSARTICDLYKARWTIEILFKELKQTLQLQSFYGTNANAVKWQIWSALIVHLVLRYLAFLSQWRGSYSRFVGIVRTAIWEKTDLDRLLKFYCIAAPPSKDDKAVKAPYLPGFEKAYLKAIG